MVPPDAAPARLGRYELIARLATGGMGEIFLARLEGAAGFEKLFVLKRILPHLADDVRFREMLIAEARIASIMTHPNVCQVYELGETEGQLYIVMEYLEGITVLPLLHRLSKEGGVLEFGFVGGVIQQAVEGLHYAHELKGRGGEPLGIVHRDVTPSNIFLTETGIVKILDFGIAKVKDASAHTQTGTVKGKYAYMAPEQLRGAGIDRRADVFALAIVLFEMLALRRLFQRKTDYLTFRAVMEQPIPDVRHYRPDCSPQLAAVLARALDRDPTQRFDSVRQLGSAVVDAIHARQRPWGHGEIGDFVGARFAVDIQNRGEQIAHAARTGTVPSIPAIAPTAVDPESETEPDFPAVDSAVTPNPVLARIAEQAQVQVEATRIDPRNALNASSQQPVVVVSGKRSLLWPVVAFAMVAVATGALILAWQKQQPPPEPPKVIINSGNSPVTPGSNSVEIGAPPAPADAAVVVPAPPPVDPGNPDRPSSSGSAGSSARPIKPPARQPSPEVDFTVVVNSLVGQTTQCAAQHGEPPAGTRVWITIGQDGRVKVITIDRQSVDGSPLGACLKRVFRGAAFPKKAGDYKFYVDVSPGSAG